MRVSRSSWLLIVVLVVMVNFPLAHSTWTRASVERSGEVVSARVTESENLGTDAEPKWWLSYELPRDIDPDQRAWASQVDAATYDEAVESGTVSARVIAGKPAGAIVEGEVRGSAALIGTLVADAVLLALILLLWRFRGPGRREVETVEALEDVRPAPAGSSTSAWEDL